MSLPLTPSQTVGPFFGVGLPYEGGEKVVASDRAGARRLEGQVLDGNGEPVPDALIEIWEPTLGFGRMRTDPEGAFSFVIARPQPGLDLNGHPRAPHLNVTVFARGLLRLLVTRIYFPDENRANAEDPVLALVDPVRRSTLIARDDGGILRFDIHLQGDQETVFFAI